MTDQEGGEVGFRDLVPKHRPSPSSLLPFEEKLTVGKYHRRVNRCPRKTERRNPYRGDRCLDSLPLTQGP